MGGVVGHWLDRGFGWTSRSSMSDDLEEPRGPGSRWSNWAGAQRAGTQAGTHNISPAKMLSRPLSPLMKFQVSIK